MNDPQQLATQEELNQLRAQVQNAEQNLLRALQVLQQYAEGSNARLRRLESRAAAGEEAIARLEQRVGRLDGET